MESRRLHLTEREIYIGYQDKIRLYGVYYGVARGPHVSEMPIIYRLKTIVQLRDPRDCLTSGYYSLKVSHGVPVDPQKREMFLKRRKELENLEIDEYVIEPSKNYRNRIADLAQYN